MFSVLSFGRSSRSSISSRSISSISSRSACGRSPASPIPVTSANRRSSFHNSPSYHSTRASSAKMTLFALCFLLATFSMSDAFRFYRDSSESEDNTAVNRAMQLQLLSRLLRANQLSSSISSSMLDSRHRESKRGPAGCINNCVTGGMSFVRCKSMCH